MSTYKSQGFYPKLSVMYLVSTKYSIINKLGSYGVAHRSFIANSIHGTSLYSNDQA